MGGYLLKKAHKTQGGGLGHCLSSSSLGRKKGKQEAIHTDEQASATYSNMVVQTTPTLSLSKQALHTDTAGMFKFRHVGFVYIQFYTLVYIQTWLFNICVT